MNLNDATVIIDNEIGAFRADNSRAVRELFQTSPPGERKSQTERAKELDEEHCVAVSEACHAFASCGAWPLLPPQQQLLVYERLRAAKEFLWALAASQAALQASPIAIDPEADRQTVVAFLLVHYWGLLGRRLWLASKCDPPIR